MPDNAEKKCVVCGAKEPADGRFLRCTHIICLSCLTERRTTQGSVECLLCREVTEPWFGVPLSEELPRCNPLLYVTEQEPRPEDDEERTGATNDLLTCDFCAEDETGAATHRCVDCAGAALCKPHAASHQKRRPHHALTELRPDAGGEEAAAVTRCLVHAKYKIDKFCETCTKVVCEKCLALGHNGHAVKGLSEAARELRAVMKTAIEGQGVVQTAAGMENPCGDAARTTTDANEDAKMLQARLAEAGSDLEALETDIPETVGVIKSLFTDMRTKLAKKKAALLLDVDQLRWKHQQLVEHRQGRLRSLRLTRKLVEELASRLTDPTLSTDMDVAQLGSIVLSKLRSFGDDIQSAIGQRKLMRSNFLVDQHALRQMTENDPMVIRDELIGASNWLLTGVPKRTEYKRTIPATLTWNGSGRRESRKAKRNPCDCSTEPTPSSACVMQYVKAMLTTPSGTQEVTVPEIKDRSGIPPEFHDGTMSAQVHLCPTDIGNYRLEFICGKEQVAEADFYVHTSIRFDGQGLNRGLVMDQQDKDAVTMLRLPVKAVQRCVCVSTFPRTKGRLRWRVEVSGEGVGAGRLELGVRCPKNDARGIAQEERGEWCIWKDSGENRQPHLATTQWCAGDIITLELDCDASTLEIHLHRTGERKMATGLNGPFFFPCVSFEQHCEPCTVRVL